MSTVTPLVNMTNATTTTTAVTTIVNTTLALVTNATMTLLTNATSLTNTMTTHIDTPEPTPAPQTFSPVTPAPPPPPPPPPPPEETLTDAIEGLLTTTMTTTTTAAAAAATTTMSDSLASALIGNSDGNGEGELREPLALVSSGLWLHAIFMMISFAVLMPFGVVAARRRSGWHRYTQFTLVGIAMMGAGLAIFENAITGMYDDCDDDGDGGGVGDKQGVGVGILHSHWTKRHLPSVSTIQHHEHSNVHAIGGMLLIGALIIQVAIGCLASPQNRSMERNAASAASLHRILGTVVAFVWAPLQIFSGVTSALQLCSSSLSGIDQCIGHNAIGLPLLVAGTAYYVLGDSTVGRPAKQWQRRYYVFAIENGIAATVGILIVLYSLYSEVPYNEHPNGVHHISAGVILFVLSSIGIALVARAMHTTKRMGSIEVRGLVIGISAIVSAVFMFVHHQMTRYGHTLHTLFGVELLGVAVARFCLAFRTLGLLCFLAAMTFMGSQRGIQILFKNFYMQQMTIASSAIVLLVIATALFVLMAVYVRALKVEPRRKKISLPDIDTADVDDLHQLGFAADADEGSNDSGGRHSAGNRQGVELNRRVTAFIDE